MAISEALLEIEEKLEVHSTPGPVKFCNSLLPGSSTGKKANVKQPKLELRRLMENLKTGPSFVTPSAAL